MKAIIIDDEKNAITVLSEMLKSYNNLKIVGSFTNPIDAYNELVYLNPDVIFLDIELKNENGIKFAEKFLTLQPNIEIVFVTAYSEYAIEAFELNAVDYLLKPISDKRLKKAITRLLDLPNFKGKRNTHNYIKSFGNFELIHADEPISWRTQKAKELFIYLWVHQGQFITKEKLIDTLYPEREYTKSQSIFYTLIYQLRKTLSDIKIEDAIQLQNGNYRLNFDFESDYKTLLSIIDDDLSENTIQLILDHYKGAFLESESYDWAHALQTKINTKVVSSLSQYLEQTMNTETINPLLERVINLLYEIDPYNEKIHENSLLYFNNTKQVQKAYEKQESFIKRLKDDIGILY